MAKDITPVMDALLQLNHALQIYNVERGDTKILLTTGDLHSDCGLIQSITRELYAVNASYLSGIQIQQVQTGYFEFLGMKIQIGKPNGA